MNGRTICCRTIAGSAAAVLAMVVLAGASPGGSAETPLASIEQDIKILQAQVKNASMRLKHVTGGTNQPRGGLVPSTRQGVSVQSCCGSNLKVMQQKLASILVSLKELQEQHRKTNDQQALQAVSHMAETFREMEKAFRSFARANSLYAEPALSSLTASFSHFRQSTGKYAECCGVDAPEKEKQKEKNKQIQRGDVPSSF